MFFASSSKIRVIIGGHCAQPSPAMFLRDHMAGHSFARPRSCFLSTIVPCMCPRLTLPHSRVSKIKLIVGPRSHIKHLSFGRMAALYGCNICKTLGRFWSQNCITILCAYQGQDFGRITVPGFWSPNCRPTVATSDAWFPCRQCTGRTPAVRGVHSLERSRQRLMSLGFRMCWFGACI